MDDDDDRDAFDAATVKTKYIALNGETSLPKGYFWSKPEITQLNALASHTLKREGIQVGRSRSLVKGLASVVQLVFSSITLYEARGSQLQRYGYAAFGLSVFPYTLMTFVNLVVGTIVGEYSTLFVLRTAISDEAKRCGGTISGEIGTLPEATLGQPANAVESPVEEDPSLNGIMMEIGIDDEDGHVTPSPKVDANKTTTIDTPHKIIGSVGAGGDGYGKDGSGVPMSENPEMFLSGKPLIAAYLRVEDDGVLVITMKGQTRRFKLIEGDDDDPLTFHFHVSALTNQEKVPKREDISGTIFLVFLSIFFILIILPYVFIFLLTGFRKGDSTKAQRGWMVSWLVFDQIFTSNGLAFSISHIDISEPTQAAKFVLGILVFCAPAIGGFVVVGRMILEFGTCSVF